MTLVDAQPQARIDNEPRTRRSPTAKGRFTRWARLLHIYITMLALLIIAFFSITGFMLNHEETFGIKKVATTTSRIQVPLELITPKDRLGLVEYLRANAPVTGAISEFRSGDGTLKFSFRSPKRNTEVTLDEASGNARLLHRARGLNGVLTELHKGKTAGPAWKLLIDSVAIFLFLACLSGFAIWLTLPKHRIFGLIGLATSVCLCILVFLLLVP